MEVKKKVENSEKRQCRKTEKEEIRKTIRKIKKIGDKKEISEKKNQGRIMKAK